MKTSNQPKSFHSNEFEKLIDHISQAEALTEIGLHLNYEFFGDKSLFYYFLTLNNILEQALQLSFKLQKS
jgi:hypothetical protein